ncbi:hypothetical protein KDM88_17130 [Undibacterium sp. BYS50W]|nr:hypothetical protein [Undibacterium rugosum]
MAHPDVAVLFARSDSVYKSLPGCDVFDVSRDARNFSGGCPVVAHPPCRAWGRLSHFAKPRHDEKELALFSVEMVRRWGGVLEHPTGSKLWAAANLPLPGHRDQFGGFTFPIFQHWFGHRAEKSTLLYICGPSPVQLPEIPLSLEYPQFVVQSRLPGRKHISKAEREHTPIELAKWLVSVARLVPQ